MVAPRIVIAGSADPVRQCNGGYDPPLPDADAVRDVARKLGAELARKECRLVVYSADKQYIEADVVAAFVMACPPGMEKNIEVHFPVGATAPAFADCEGSPSLFSYLADSHPDWEASYYRSLGDVDGIVLLGGGNAVLITGYLALGYRIPLFALAGFGGASQKVWQALAPGRDLPTPEEKSAMATGRWTDQTAEACVKALLDQIARRRDEIAADRREARTRQRGASMQSLASLILSTLAIATIPVSNAVLAPSHWTFTLLLYFAGPIAGASGAVIRALWSAETGRSGLLTGVLGFAAGGVASILFLFAQLSLGSTTATPQATAVPIAVAIGFIAGFTFDRVYRKLAETDVTRVEALRVDQAKKLV